MVSHPSLALTYRRRFRCRACLSTLGRLLLLTRAFCTRLHYGTPTAAFSGNQVVPFFLEAVQALDVVLRVALVALARPSL